MKVFRKLLCFLCAAFLAFGLVACGGSNTPGQGDGDDDELSGTINIYVPFGSTDQRALQQVANAYMRLNRNVTVNIQANPSDQYTEAVRGIILAPEETDIDIVQINVASEYYGTDRIIDFTSYLNQRNPYGETDESGNYPIWRDMLEEEAYFTDDGSYTIPALSYESNYLMVFYSKDLFEDNGWEPPETWQELLDLLAAAREAGYVNPLGLNYDETGVENFYFGSCLQMYMDQYFRDVIDTVHSQEGDYSYIDSIDYGWEYSSEDPYVDSREQYTYNISRLIDAYFNGSDINATSARFADMMANFYDLTRYSSSSYTAATMRNAFHNGVLTALGGASYSKEESCVLYMGRMDYISDFQTSIGAVLDFPNDSIPAEQIGDYLGWFVLPVMPDNASVSGGEPAADNVRPFGGPDHHPMGIINHNDQERTNLVMDFMMFWYSPQGMDYFYGYYGDIGTALPLTCLVKDVQKPENSLVENIPEFEGLCSLNPYLEIGIGYDVSIYGSSGTVRDGFVDTIRSYLTSSSSAWSSYGQTMHLIILSGFSNYASAENLRFSDPAESVNYFQNSPYRTTQ